MRIYSDRFDQPLIGSSSNTLYKEAHDGFSITFNHSHPWWESSLKMGLEANKLSGISRQLARVIQFEPALVDRRTPYLYFEPKVIFEHRDNKAEPCKGIYTSLGCKVMIPPGVRDGWFIKAEAEQALFYPLYRSIIGALRWRLGHIFNAKFSTILPTERFYLGGASSLRGYETNMVPPLNDLTCDGRCVWVPVGGKSMANVNAEIRFPIYRWIRGVLFTDMGVLTQDTFADIAANRWLGASGLGLRVATPIGPVRFDIGWKWKKRDPRDRRYAWFLTFGHAF
jgi:outer membrane protein assembly factor BamA